MGRNAKKRRLARDLVKANNLLAKSENLVKYRNRSEPQIKSTIRELPVDNGPMGHIGP